MAAVLKTARAGNRPRGFESHTLRFCPHLGHLTCSFNCFGGYSAGPNESSSVPPWPSIWGRIGGKIEIAGEPRSHAALLLAGGATPTGFVSATSDPLLSAARLDWRSYEVIGLPASL